MVINIFQLFLGHKASATAPLLPELHTDKLPNLVRRLEEAMYRKAPSKEAYADPSTMRQRVMDVVVQLLQARAAPPAGPTPPSPAPNAKPGYETRRQLVIQIYKLFTCSSHWAATLTPAFKDQLPSFVRRLEMALYHSAASEAEYIDTTTLEARLFSVSQRLVRKDQ